MKGFCPSDCVISLSLIDTLSYVPFLWTTYFCFPLMMKSYGLPMTNPRFPYVRVCFLDPCFYILYQTVWSGKQKTC